MIIVNNSDNGTKKYIITIGVDDFCVYAKSEDEAVEVVANYFIVSGNSDWYFDAIEIEVMAESVSKSIAEFINDADLCHCKKYNICLPKCKITEVKSNG